jgi:hypothetical protein
MDAVRNIRVPGAEKRRDDGKYYAYKIDVQYESGKRISVWRRYKQLDALHSTIQQILGSKVELPRLTSKLYLKRSSVKEVAENRLPKIQRFLGQLLTFGDNPVVSKTLQFFLVPNADDIARAQLPDPEDMLRATDEGAEAMFARCLYSYTAVHDGDLSINEGDIIQVISTESGWTQGELRGKSGYFPESYVKIITDEDDDENEHEDDEVHDHNKRASAASTTSSEAPKSRTPTEELFNTEKAFVQSLTDVRDNFFPKLRAIISAPEAKTFFGNWAELIPEHEVCSSYILHPKRSNLHSHASISSSLLRPSRQALLKSLEPTGADISRILLAALPRLSPLYSKYCASIPAAQQLYEQKLRDARFGQFEASFAPLNKPTLNYIMRPVQVHFPHISLHHRQPRVVVGSR